jgi:molecular chaperone DnaK
MPRLTATERKLKEEVAIAEAHAQELLQRVEDLKSASDSAAEAAIEAASAAAEVDVMAIRALAAEDEARRQADAAAAELNAADDKKKLELIQARNEADANIHSVKKSLTEHGDKLDAAEKEKIEAAIKDLEAVIKGDDKDSISTKSTALMEASQKLGEKVYAEQQAKQAAEAGGGNAGGEQQAKPADDNVVDAEVKEVKKG